MWKRYMFCSALVRDFSFYLISLFFTDLHYVKICLSIDFALWSMQISLLKNRVNIASGTPSRLVFSDPFIFVSLVFLIMLYLRITIHYSPSNAG